MRQLFILGLLMLLALPAHADPDPVRNTDEPVHCPAILDIQTNKYDLESAGLFTGRPDDMKELEPENGSWNLEDYRPTARSFYIICHYEYTLSTLTIDIPRNVHLCNQDKKDIACR